MLKGAGVICLAILAAGEPSPARQGLEPQLLLELGLSRQRFARDGSLLVTVTRMKGRPDFKRQPGLVQIPPAPRGHPRQSVLDIIRTVLLLDPTAFNTVSDTLCNGTKKPSVLLTEKFRELVPPGTLNLPAGAIVASHSFREMGASVSMAAGYSDNKSRRHGLWRRLATMLEHYVVDEFPFSPFLAKIFDFLR
eukprot:SAG31_NODE_186_length_20918_cov_26.890917_1_plen_193_part_00